MQASIWTVPNRRSYRKLRLANDLRAFRIIIELVLQLTRAVISCSKRSKGLNERHLPRRRSLVRALMCQMVLSMGCSSVSSNKWTK